MTKHMIKRLQKLPCYFITLFILLTLIALFVGLLPKIQGFLWVNQYHTNWLDFTFKIMTNLGDGFFIIFAVILLSAIKKKKKAIAVLLAYAYSGLLVQLFKRLYNQPRPKLLMQQLHIPYTHFVQGLNVHNHSSFPSGHTASAFALSTIMVLVFKKKKISVPCILFSIAVGYSRIYLAQHFPIDVLFGALAGVLCGCLSYHQTYILKLFRPVKVAKRLKRLRMANPELITNG